MNNPSICYGRINKGRQLSIQNFVTGTEEPLTNKHGTSARQKQMTPQYYDGFCEAGYENRRRMQVAGLIEWVLDSRVLLAVPEWQKNQGKNKVCYIPSQY